MATDEERNLLGKKSVQTEAWSRGVYFFAAAAGYPIRSISQNAGGGGGFSNELFKKGDPLTSSERPSVGEAAGCEHRDDSYALLALGFNRSVILRLIEKPERRNRKQIEKAKKHQARRSHQRL